MKQMVDMEDSIFQWHWDINMLQCILDSLSFLRFCLQDIQYSFYAGNLSLMHMKQVSFDEVRI